jgi:hypothetical protein
MNLPINKFIGILTLSVCIFGPLYVRAADVQGRQPILDTDGRFWVYRNGLAHPPMPFSPYGWMSDITNLTQLIKIDPACADDPNHVIKAGTSEKESCISVKINWGDATWASVAFISGPDKPPWWGDSNRGRYYNLAGLAKKKLVFYARGGSGGETIKVQFAVLGDKPFGDSIHKPIVTEDLALTTEWTRHEIDLKDVPSGELEHICNGFGFVVERGSQPGSAAETVFYLDDIYFE